MRRPASVFSLPTPCAHLLTEAPCPLSPKKIWRNYCRISRGRQTGIPLGKEVVFKDRKPMENVYGLIKLKDDKGTLLEVSKDLEKHIQLPESQMCRVHLCRWMKQCSGTLPVLLKCYDRAWPAFCLCRQQPGRLSRACLRHANSGDHSLWAVCRQPDSETGHSSPAGSVEKHF